MSRIANNRHNRHNSGRKPNNPNNGKNGNRPKQGDTKAIDPKIFSFVNTIDIVKMQLNADPQWLGQFGRVILVDDQKCLCIPKKDVGLLKSMDYGCELTKVTLTSGGCIVTASKPMPKTWTKLLTTIKVGIPTTFKFGTSRAVIGHLGYDGHTQLIGLKGLTDLSIATDGKRTYLVGITDRKTYLKCIPFDVIQKGHTLTKQWQTPNYLSGFRPIGIDLVVTDEKVTFIVLDKVKGMTLINPTQPLYKTADTTTVDTIDERMAKPSQNTVVPTPPMNGAKETVATA